MRLITQVLTQLTVAGVFLIAAPPQDAGKLEHIVSEARWVAYAPTNYNPETSPQIIPADASILEDLRTLRKAGCSGLVTYGASLPAIVIQAENAQFRAMLLGIWDPADQNELKAAIESARRDIVVGIIVGNEGLMTKRYGLETLHKAMEAVRRATGKPVSTTEIIESFYTKPELAEWSDFVTINAHPYFHGHRDPGSALRWTVAAWERFKQLGLTKPTIFKEVGLPTNGSPELSEAAQAEYYRGLLSSRVHFVFFEGFDVLFKHGDVEKSWGLFHADRSPKAAAQLLGQTPPGR